MAKTGLIADIGATNARFALTSDDGVSDEKVLQCSDFPGIVEAASSYLEQTNPANAPSRASIAIAGPVTGDWFEMTNHPWSFSQKETQKALNLDYLKVMNDFEAVALGIQYLKSAGDVRQINTATPREHAPIGIIGPGTGLGVASLIWNGQKYCPVPGEGGHVTMPALSARELDLFKWLLSTKYSHISAERVCSGKGLVNLYNGLRGLDKLDLPDMTPEQISAAAMDGSCPTCEEALRMMLQNLGCIAGNMALTLGTHGGIYIAGGIIKQLGDYFDNSNFMEAFLAKGRFKDYLSEIPVYVVLHDFPAFLGLHGDLHA
jgi:glucokinase